MGWLSKVPKISLFLLIATYGVFGWLYSSWIVKLALEKQLWNQWVLPPIASVISYGLGLVGIIFIVLFFTAPMTLLTLGMENWFRADAKALFVIALSIAAFALIIEYPGIFAHFLVLSAAAMLFRLDLQTVGCPNKIAQLILIVLSLTAFILGALVFNFYEF